MRFAVLHVSEQRLCEHLNLELVVYIFRCLHIIPNYSYITRTGNGNDQNSFVDLNRKN